MLNADAVTTAAAGLRRGGLGGEAFSQSAFPSSGNLTLHLSGGHTVTFLIPRFGPGLASALRLDAAVSVEVPPGRYRSMWLLAAGIQGDFGPVNATVRYTDGDEIAIPVSFPDWCANGAHLADSPPFWVGVAVTHVLGPSGALAASATTPALPVASGPLHTLAADCGLWAERVSLPTPAVDVASVSLPAIGGVGRGGAYLMALTLQAVAAPTP